jgi:hypothetical protein
VVSGCRSFFLKISGTIPEFERCGLDGAKSALSPAVHLLQCICRQQGEAAARRGRRFLKAADGRFFRDLRVLIGGNLGAGTGFK